MTENCRENVQKRDIEVEAKVEVSKNQISAIKRKLKKMGFSSSGPKSEKDIYFTSRYVDFIKTRECLRIRSREGFAEMTYKGKTNGDMINNCQFWKKEFNMSISKKQIKEAIGFLKALGFMEVIEVSKKRQEFKLKYRTIAIDEVKNGGFFVEIESMVTNGNEKEKAARDNLKVLEMLEIEDYKLVKEPYRDIVIRNTEKDSKRP